MPPSAYGWFMLGGIAVSVALWVRRARREDALLPIYVAALISAFLGAKVAYVLGEGWRDIGQDSAWWRLATGKSILGALLGGYAGVELAKRWVGYRGITGDWFALIAPVGIILGRLGCWFHGCCLGRVCAPRWFALRDTAGVPRWPAVPVEILFNGLMLLLFLWLRRIGRCRGQLFHLYLIAYGLFRFGHEFWRDTPPALGPISGYQLIALAVAAFGALAFVRRRSTIQRDGRSASAIG